MNNTQKLGIGLLLVLLAGCSDDTGRRPRTPSDGGGYYQPRRVAQSLTAPKPYASDTPADPFLAPDPLAGDVSPAPPPDPLAGEDAPALGKAAAPFADPMADTPDGLSQTRGPQMPTEHSHWLRGSVFNASVEVRVNNVLVGTFRSPVDKDITMSCRDGVNTVTFAYTPTDNSAASVQLNVLESEHTPPIAPLATFRISPIGASSPPPAKPAASALPQTVTQTITFVAK